ncbi:MAG TPA: glycosyltransferase family 1 protein [Candidatus Andersenbacteria bacterium]|nr:glycosyltransferase family 1 protein [Candidatus Andersenbacteria bacterium]
MKTIGLITNASEHSGVGSRAYQLFRHMGKQEDFEISFVMLDGSNNSLVRLPGFLGSKSVSWIRLARRVPQFDMYDISNQTLSFMAKKRHPSIVTVHDIIELIDPQAPKAYLLNKYLMSGITYADRIIAVSQYTKKTIQDYFTMDESTITVIPNGIDEAYCRIQNFKSSIAYQELLRNLKISDRSPIVLSVGSEHPRKNMKTILGTVSLLKKQFPNILLIKVGDAGLLSGRKETLNYIDQLALQDNVQLLGNISNELLNELYNIADVLLFPSRHEGFGLPPLEAMAAGCPVVCSNSTSLPEVVGNGAIMHDPDDTGEFAKSIARIVSDVDFKTALLTKGKERVKEFSWRKAAQQTLELYRL